MDSPTRTLCAVIGFAGIAFGPLGFGGCGGQTGEGDPGSNECVDEAPEPLDDTAPSALGFSAAEISTLATGQPIELARGGSGLPPLPAAISVRPRPGSARFVPTRQGYEVGMPEACRGRIEQDADVTLTLRAASGDLPLTATGTLTADSPYRTRLRAKFPEAAFAALQSFELAPGESFDGLELRALLTPAGSAGALTAQIASLMRVGPQPEPTGDAPRARDTIATRAVEVAHWPAGSACARGELPLAPNQALFEVTPEQIARQTAGPRTLRWNDGTTTTLRLDVTGLGPTCLADLYPEWFSPIEWPPIGPEDPALFGVRVELAIETEDGRFRSDASVMLQYRARKTGGLERAWFQHTQTLASGDAGGWAASAADHGVPRSTWLQLGVPAIEGRSMLLLLGQASASSCSSASSMCTSLPPAPPTLIRGTIE